MYQLVFCDKELSYEGHGGIEVFVVYGWDENEDICSQCNKTMTE